MERQVARFLLELAGRNASPHTITAYKSDLARFVAWLMALEVAVHDVTAIKREHCIDWVSTMRLGGFASSTVARRYAAVRAWIYWLVLHKVIAPIDIPRHVHRDERPLPNVPGPDAVAAIIATCNATGYCGARDRAILEFLYSTGARAAELCNLRLGDIATDRRSARVLGKGRKERLVALGASARKALRVYLDEWRRPAHDPQSVQLVFLTRDGGALSTRTLGKIVERAVLAAHLKGFSTHSMRHAMATHMVDHGANLLAVKELLGHASVASTQLYVKLSPSKMLREHKEHHPRGEGQTPMQDLLGPTRIRSTHETGPSAEGPTGRE